MTGITLSAVAVICARSQQEDSDSLYIFTASPLARHALAGVVVFCCFVTLLRAFAEADPSMQFFFGFSPLWGGALLGLICLLRYRVIVTDTTLTVVTFTRRQFSFEDVIDYDVIIGGRYGNENSVLLMYLRDGTKLRLTNLLGDFDDLIGLVNSHIASPPHGQPNCPAKLLDRAVRVRNARIMDWLGYVSIAVVTGFLIWAWVTLPHSRR
jgi:hypothetical protein